MPRTYAELHSHSNFSVLHGASTVEEMTERAAALGLSGLAVTDHDGLYGVVRFTTAAQAVGVRPVIGIEIELVDAAAPDPSGVVVPARRAGRGAARGRGSPLPDLQPIEGLPARPRPARPRLPGPRAGGNTTIAVVATNARLSKAEMSRIALMADDALARAINPSHTTGDGDTVFALATNRWTGQASVSIVGALAADVLAEAIVRAVSTAEPLGGLPSARALGTAPPRVR